MLIKTVSDFRKAMRETKNIYPGGYEFVFHASGGGHLCRKCVKQNAARVVLALALRDEQDIWYLYGSESTSQMEGPVICDECDKILLDVD